VSLVRSRDPISKFGSPVHILNGWNYLYMPCQKKLKCWKCDVISYSGIQLYNLFKIKSFLVCCVCTLVKSTNTTLNSTLRKSVVLQKSIYLESPSIILHSLANDIVSYFERCCKTLVQRCSRKLRQIWTCSKRANAPSFIIKLQRKTALKSVLEYFGCNGRLNTALFYAIGHPLCPFCRFVFIRTWCRRHQRDYCSHVGQRNPITALYWSI